ncbi:hypothetical protein K2173_006481 [Erythroxylum novogranatense]|uniref:PGG domain-containing protein n=1 Tax=Erythroxylum novogranatense TaxID=1862640 RepID=A0AAV8TF46_9ROSI|nr:hypothetical protein K2173_006481 [Erythroxylum novogranatense]
MAGVNRVSPNIGTGNFSSPYGKPYIAVMDDSLFFKAVEGDIQAFNPYKDYLDQLVTPNGDSILHICITGLPFPDREHPTAGNGKFINLAKWVAKSCPDLLRKQNKKVDTTLHIAARHDTFINLAKWVVKICPDLLRRQNKKGDTPLHIAARHGHFDIAIELVKLCEISPQNDEEKGVVGAAAAREMIAMKNEDGDTALHEAIRLSTVYDQLKLSQLLILLTQERNISYEPNMYGETPLYLAVERAVGKAVVQVILQNQPPPAHCGPNGRTALHSAVIRNNREVTELLLENEDKRKALIKQDDQKGWIPLHYAAYFGYRDIVQLLLKDKRSAAYTPTNDENKMLPLHLAASSGHVEVMGVIINLCPGCCELVDQRKWNVLHFAVDGGKEEAVTYILNHPLLKNLINKKNVDGSTPLHKLADSGSFMKSFVTHPQVDKLAFNDRNLNVLDLLLSADGLWGQRKDEVKTEGSDEVNKGDAGKIKDKSSDDTMDYIKDAREAHLVVATLIATVTFAAGFTLPGGYKGEGGPDEGGAILTRRTAFQAFIITNTIAMMLSSAAVFVHLFMALDKDKTKVYRLFKLVLKFTIYAMFAMVVAFITGTYAVLFHTSSLAISTCVLGCLFFLLYIKTPVDKKLPDKPRKKSSLIGLRGHLA